VITYQGETIIERPVDQVFAYAAAYENLPQWSDVSDVAMLTDDPIGQGTRLRMTMGKGPMRATLDFDTAEWEPNRIWSYTTVPPASILWDATYSLEPISATSTRIITHGQITLKGWRRMLEPLVRAEVGKGEQLELDKLKTIIEQLPRPETDV
jgi:Polyketide cyclase / dehydrase and lipid transport